MADFNSEFWPWFIGIVSLLGIGALVWLLLANSKVKAPPAGEEVKATGHVWDEDLEELNSPLPKWWLNMFYITIVFGLGYLLLYPGLGFYQGLLGWTQIGEYQEELDYAKAEYDPIFEHFASKDIPTLAKDASAIRSGERLYVSYCAVCHGSDARGAPGFPNLRDKDWLFGGSPQAIKTSIVNGRSGVMPAWGGPLGEAGVKQVTDYVMTLSGRKPLGGSQSAIEGQGKYLAFCAGCHLPTGTGNAALGAANLTDDIWLYGGSPRAISQSIAEGRQGKMPAHKDFLGEAKSHVLAAYVYSLSQQ